MRAYITATALLIMASVSLFFPVCASGSPGDMNGDGNVDLADTTLALQILSGMDAFGFIFAPNLTSIPK